MDVDVLLAADNRLAWYENIDGKGRFGDQQLISTVTDHVISVHAGDKDGDGDVDVLSSSWEDGTKIAWYENTDGEGGFGEPEVITMGAVVGSSYAVDVEVTSGPRRHACQSEMWSAVDGTLAVFASRTTNIIRR